MKRIGIDARMFGQGFGLARYIQQLLFQFIRHEDKEVCFVVFLRNEAQKKVLDEQLKLYNNAQIRFVVKDIPWYSLKEQVLFPGLIKKQKLDFMFFPHWNVPYLYRDPYIIAIHDLTMFHHPRPEATTRGRLVFWLKDKAHRFLLRHIVKQALHIVTTTQYVKNDVAKTLAVPKEKMTVVYQAAFSIDSLQKEHNNLEYKKVRESYQLPEKPFIFYLGAAYPHKNLEMLLSAWLLYEEEYDDDTWLILGGKEDYFYRRLQESEVFQACQRVRYLGFLPDEDVDAIYQSARAFVWPSLSEGFGLPPLEAMARKIPVISSHATCLPEILGDACLYADPENLEQWAMQVDRVVQDADLRAELIQRGAQQAKYYDWERFGQEIKSLLLSYLPGKH